MGIARHILNICAVKAYTSGAKILETPQIILERKPRLISDQIVSPAVGNKYAIVVKYSAFGVTPDFLDLLEALRNCDVNPIIVCNGRLTDADRAALDGKVHCILVRKNQGRDFGAYRAATLYLHAKGYAPERLLYLNDSVIYLRGTHLDAMVRALVDSVYDVVGTFENHQFVHHFGTYAFSISRTVFNDSRILKFWRTYRPYNLRPHTIRRGEAGLAEHLKKYNYRIDVIYSVDKLALLLDAMTLHELVAHLKYVPFGTLRNFDLKALLAATSSTGRLLSNKHDGGGKKVRLKLVLDAAPRPQFSMISSEPAPVGPPNAKQKMGDNISAIHDRTIDEIKRLALVNIIMDAIINGSQIHLGFGLFFRLMSSPLVKRDLLMRDIFLEHDCIRIMQDLPEPTRGMIMREIINRGRNVNRSLWWRFKLNNGLI